MYGCAKRTIKKDEHQRIDAFELWSWRRFLRVPWTAKKSNQWILKEISPEYSLEGLMPQYFGHLIQTTNSIEKTLMLGKIEGRRRKGRQRMFFTKHHWLNGHEFEQTPAESRGQRSLASYSPRGSQRVDHNLANEQQYSSWTAPSPASLSLYG